MKRDRKRLMIILAIGAMIFYMYYMLDSNEMSNQFVQDYSFDSYEQIEDNPIVYEVTYNNQKGYLIFGSETGYQSDVVVASLITESGKLISVRTYSENETPAFYQRLREEKFFEKNFSNVMIAQGFSTETNVDVITGATISSKAVTRAIHDSASYIGEKYIGIQVMELDRVPRFGIVEWVIILMLLLAFLSYRFKNNALRTLTLVYSFVLMGLKFVQFISYSTFISAITLNYPNLYENLNWYLLFFGSIILVVVTGKNLYCTYICPFGAMQQLEYKAAKLDFFKVQHRIKKYARLLPGYIAYIAFAIAMLTGNVSAVSYEPFSLVFGRIGNGVHWLILPIVLLMPLFLMRFYCHYGCPVGFIWKLVLATRKKVVVLWGN